MLCSSEMGSREKLAYLQLNYVCWQTCTMNQPYNALAAILYKLTTKQCLIMISVGSNPPPPQKNLEMLCSQTYTYTGKSMTTNIWWHDMTESLPLDSVLSSLQSTGEEDCWGCLKRPVKELSLKAWREKNSSDISNTNYSLPQNLSIVVHKFWSTPAPG